MMMTEAKEKIKQAIESIIQRTDELIPTDKPTYKTDIYMLSESSDEVDEGYLDSCELWGELSICTTDSNESYDFAVCMGGKGGRVDDEELAEALAELEREAEVFLDRLNAGIPLGELIRQASQERDREAEEAMKEFDKSVFSYKRSAILIGIAAVVIIAVMLLLEKLLLGE